MWHPLSSPNGRSVKLINFLLPISPSSRSLQSAGVLCIQHEHARITLVSLALATIIDKDHKIGATDRGATCAIAMTASISNKYHLAHKRTCHTSSVITLNSTLAACITKCKGEGKMSSVISMPIIVAREDGWGESNRTLLITLIFPLFLCICFAGWSWANGAASYARQSPLGVQGSQHSGEWLLLTLDGQVATFISCLNCNDLFHLFLGYLSKFFFSTFILYIFFIYLLVLFFVTYLMFKSSINVFLTLPLSRSYILSIASPLTLFDWTADPSVPGRSGHCLLRSVASTSGKQSKRTDSRAR